MESPSGLIWPQLWGRSQRNKGFGSGYWLGRLENVLEMKPPMYEDFIWALLSECTDAVLLPMYSVQTSDFGDQRLQQWSTKPSYPRQRAKPVFQASTELSATSVRSKSSPAAAAPKAMRDQRSKANVIIKCSRRGVSHRRSLSHISFDFSTCMTVVRKIFPDKAEGKARLSFVELETRLHPCSTVLADGCLQHGQNFSRNT